MDNRPRINLISILIIIVFLFLSVTTFYVLRWWEYQKKTKTLLRLQSVLKNSDTLNTYRYVLTQDKSIDYNEAEIHFVSTGHISTHDFKNSIDGIPIKLFILEGYTFDKKLVLRNLKLAVYAILDHKSDEAFNTLIREVARVKTVQLDSNSVVISVKTLKSIFVQGTPWSISVRLTPIDRERFTKPSENWLYAKLTDSLRADYYEQVRNMIENGLTHDVSNILLIPSSLYPL